jgi:hypothetical protein
VAHTKLSPGSLVLGFGPKHPFPTCIIEQQHQNLISHIYPSFPNPVPNGAHKTEPQQLGFWLLAQNLSARITEWQGKLSTSCFSISYPSCVLVCVVYYISNDNNNNFLLGLEDLDLSMATCHVMKH